MVVTNVISEEAQYDRLAWLILCGDKVVFDDSDGEYGPTEFDLSLLEEKIKEHKEKLKLAE